MKVLYDLPFKTGYPFVIAFIYPKKRKPFIMKGSWNYIRDKLRQLNIPAVVHFTIWKYGSYISQCDLVNIKGAYVSKGRRCLKKFNKFCAIINRENSELIKGFRRFPRSWIKELDPYC